MSLARRSRDERGAVAVMTALVMSTVLIAIATFAVDLGMGRVGRRDMQAVADTVALDLSRLVDGRTRSSIESGSATQPSLSSALAASVSRNDGDAVGSNISVTPYLVQVDPVTGSYATGTGGVPAQVAAGAVPNAVVVVAKTYVGFVFGEAAGVSPSRSAVATSSKNACYSVDSYALGFASNSSVLGPLLGPAASARVLSSRGLATASVSLFGVAGRLGVGTPDQLVTAQGVSVGSFLTAAAQVLSADGNTADADVASQVLALKGDLGPVAGDPINFANLLDVGQGHGSALDSQISILDVVTGALILDNPTTGHFLEVPDLKATVTGVANLDVRLYLTAPPKIACDGGTAQAAQGYLEVTGTVGLCGALLALCSDIDVRISLANASGRSNPASACDATQLPLDVFDQTLAKARLTATVYANVALLGKIPVAKVDTGAPPTAPEKTYVLPLPSAYTTPVETSSGAIGLSLSNADVQLLGVVGVNVGGVTSLLNPLLSTVDNKLLPALLGGLGLTIDGADLLALPYVSCSSPSLIG